MDMQRPTAAPSPTMAAVRSPAQRERLLEALDATAAGRATTDSQAGRDENRRATRELFESLDPCDPTLEATAIAEEEAMIAEQLALETT